MTEETKIELSSDLELLKKALTIKQLEFVHGLAHGMTELEAFENAGLAQNDDTDRSNASRLARAPKIRLYKEALQREVATRSVMSLEAVDQELTNIASADVTDVIKVGEWVESIGKRGPIAHPVLEVSMVEFDDLTDAQRAAIKKIKPVPGGVEVVMHDKMKALELLAKRHQGFTEKIDMNVDSNVQVFAFVGDNGRGPTGGD